MQTLALLYIEAIIDYRQKHGYTAQATQNLEDVIKIINFSFKEITNDKILNKDDFLYYVNEGFDRFDVNKTKLIQWEQQVFEGSTLQNTIVGAQLMRK